MKLTQRNLKSVLSDIGKMSVVQKGTPLGVILETQDDNYLLNRAIEELRSLSFEVQPDESRLDLPIFLLSILKLKWTPST